MEYEPSMFARLVRARCPECKGRLRWYPLGAAVTALGELKVRKLITRAGESISTNDDDLEFWECRRNSCQEIGMLASPADCFYPSPERPAGRRVGEPARKRSGGGSPAGGRPPF